jgi:hypothetical protein
MSKEQNRTGRRLTYDEIRAAEDAFQGRPFNEASSQAARTVYEGVLVAKLKLNQEQSMRGLPAPSDSQKAEQPLGVEMLLREFAESYRL